MVYKKGNQFSKYKRLHKAWSEFNSMQHDFDHIIYEKYLEYLSCDTTGWECMTGIYSLDEWEEKQVELVFKKRRLFRKTKYWCIYIDLRKFFEWLETTSYY